MTKNEIPKFTKDDLKNVTIPRKRLAKKTTDLINLASYEGRMFSWQIEDSGLADYEASFGPVVDEDIEQFLQRQENPTVLDVMSFDSFLKDLVALEILYKGVCVNLGSFSKRKVLLDSEPKIYEIVGNILEKSTIEKIQKWKNSNAKSGFDLIINHGCGGIATLPQDACFQYALLNTFYAMLKPDGLLLTHVMLPKRLLIKFITFLQFNGIQAKYGESYAYGSKALKETGYKNQLLRITKPKNNSSLPRITLE